jgi:hypothetical protein
VGTRVTGTSEKHMSDYRVYQDLADSYGNLCRLAEFRSDPPIIVTKMH